jgi:2'-5' RNA ligase
MTTNAVEAAAAKLERLRLFFAAWPAEPTAAVLHAWAARAQAEVGGRVIPVANIHLTLAFLGDVPAVGLAQAVGAAQRVAGEVHALPVDEARYWPRSRIVWVGPKKTPAPLAALAADLADKLREAGFALDERPFAAHVTLIRNARLRGLPPLPAVEWPISEFALVRSTPAEAGSKYEIVERFPLA